MEAKALTCNIVPGRLPRGPAFAEFLNKYAPQTCSPMLHPEERSFRAGGSGGVAVRTGVGVNGRRELRFALAFALLLAIAFLADSALASSRSETSLQTLNRKVLASVNRFRARHGLLALRESAALDGAARRHSFEMGRLGYFSHSSADGVQFWQRIRHFSTARGNSYSARVRHRARTRRP